MLDNYKKKKFLHENSIAEKENRAQVGTGERIKQGARCSSLGICRIP